MRYEECEPFRESVRSQHSLRIACECRLYDRIPEKTEINVLPAAAGGVVGGALGQPRRVLAAFMEECVVKSFFKKAAVAFVLATAPMRPSDGGSCVEYAGSQCCRERKATANCPDLLGGDQH